MEMIMKINSMLISGLGVPNREQVSGLDVLDRREEQWSGCIGLGIGSVAWICWTVYGISGLDVLDRG